MKTLPDENLLVEQLIFKTAGTLCRYPVNPGTVSNLVLPRAALVPIVIKE